MISVTETSPAQKQNICKECLIVLKDALQNGETIFIKVHAAEALMFNDYYTGIGTTFNKLVKEQPNLIVASRVLARVYKNDKAKYQAHLNTLLYQLTDADSTRGKLIALESLAKIGFQKPLPEITLYADTGTNGFKAMARWVLSNSNKPADEDDLAKLLTSVDPTEFRGAAYALRFKKKIEPKTLQLLTACAKRVEKDNAARVYVLSSWYVHTVGAKAEKEAKENLLTYMTGAVNERYEVAEAFSMKGTVKDIPTLNKLMADENMDVRVAAAKALWSIKAPALK
ncbi:MAG: HEAT repeat domain-containing protein [Segetibacter sp.]